MGYGIQLYANVYYTTDKELAEHPKELASWMAATAPRLGYARDHQEEAVNFWLRRPQSGQASEMDAIGPLMKFAFNENTKTAAGVP